MTTFDPDWLYSQSIETLAQMWAGVDDEVQAAVRRRHEIEQAIASRMNAEKAELREVETDDGRMVRLSYGASIVYDDSTLVALKALLSEDEWESILNKPKPRYVNKRKIKTLEKRGGKIREVIEASRRESPPTLKVEKK